MRVTPFQVVSPAPRQLWETLFAADRTAAPSLAPGWMDAIASRGPYRDASRLYSFPSGRRMIVPLAARRLLGAPIAEESWPHDWGYGGALVEGGLEPTLPEARQILFDLSRRRVLQVAMVSPPQRAALWADAAPKRALTVPHRSQLVDLDGGFATVSRGISRSTGEHARRANRSGVEIVQANSDALLSDFTRLYTSAERRWGDQKGLPPWLVRRLATSRDRPGQVRAVLQHCPDVVQVWGAFFQGEPVCVSVTLQHGDIAFGWLAAVDVALSRRTRGSSLLISTQLEAACAKGCRWFDMGESNPGGGVEEHKRQYGAQVHDFVSVHLERLPVLRAIRLSRALALRGMAARSPGSGPDSS